MSRTTRRTTRTGAGEAPGHVSSKSRPLRGRAASGSGFVVTPRGAKNEIVDLVLEPGAGPEHKIFKAEVIKAVMHRPFTAKKTILITKKRIAGITAQVPQQTDERADVNVSIDERMLELERKVSLLSQSGIWRSVREVASEQHRFDDPVQEYVVGKAWPWGGILGVHEPDRASMPLPPQKRKLDGPLDRTRFTLKPVDPATLRESRQRATLARLGLDPDKQD